MPKWQNYHYQSPPLEHNRFADQIIVLENEKLIESGNRKQLFAQNKILSALNKAF